MQRGAPPAVTFEEVAVGFSPEEWEQLVPWQRALHRRVMCDNYELVASLEPSPKFSPMKEESPGRVPSGAPDTSDPCARSGCDSKDGPGGHRDPAAPTGGAEADPERPHLCRTCGKSFRHRRSLLAHKKLRGGARARHGCAECGRGFCLRGDLLRHRDSHRARPAGPRRGPAEERAGDERPFACGRCGLRFSWRESLQLHLRAHRAPQRAHACPECGRAFQQPRLLALHRRAHAGTRPFPCARCGRAFASQAKLSSHRRTRRHCRARGTGTRGDGDGDGDRNPRGDRNTRGDGD
ncbi:zinc finger protein LOC728743 homolog, partial [Oenanthe melanoleuca]|uniref:zinc finger protein LOC728743 homolog n=1 Tax=Oenanthe melanoleuca TaxID=2939378 RepID=UPI0024C1A6E4